MPRLIIKSRPIPIEPHHHPYLPRLGAKASIYKQFGCRACENGFLWVILRGCPVKSGVSSTLRSVYAIIMHLECMHFGFGTGKRASSNTSMKLYRNHGCGITCEVAPCEQAVCSITLPRISTRKGRCITHRNIYSKGPVFGSGDFCDNFDMNLSLGDEVVVPRWLVRRHGLPIRPARLGISPRPEISHPT